MPDFQSKLTATNSYYYDDLVIIMMISNTLLYFLWLLCLIMAIIREGMLWFPLIEANYSGRNA